MFLFRPAFEASLGSHYSLSGFVIPRYSKLRNHLVEHVEIVHFKILGLKNVLRLFGDYFFFTLTFRQSTLIYTGSSVECKFGSGWGLCFAAARPLGQQQESIG